MTTSALATDLEWWRANRDAPARDEAAARAVLARLQAWKAKHDEDRARHPPPFLRMAWDGVFADEDSRVVAAIGEMEAALGA